MSQYVNKKLPVQYHTTRGFCFLIYQIGKSANCQIAKLPNQQIGKSLSYRQTSQQAIVAIARHLFL